MPICLLLFVCLFSLFYVQVVLVFKQQDCLSRVLIDDILIGEHLKLLEWSAYCQSERLGSPGVAVVVMIYVIVS